MIEFAVVGPVITLLGLAVLQYGMLFFAKNQINYAAFMAARAGSVDNASLGSAKEAYIRALIPLYGGGTNDAELEESACKARDAVEGTKICLKEKSPGARIEILSPTRESFDDWSDLALQSTVGKGKGKDNSDARVIPNGGQAYKNPDDIKANSGQSIQDANLIKLRITHGYEPKVPLIKAMYTKYLQWLDPKTDDFHTKLVNAGRIPVVTHVTLQMQSDAIEPDNPVSMPGMGNNGNPSDPGDPPVVATDPPNCLTIGCTVNSTPVTPVDPVGPCVGSNCPVCSGSAPVPPLALSADALFPFDKSSLADVLPAGRAKLDQLIAAAKNAKIESANVTGYTDQLGSAAHNNSLSLARAQTVRDYLVSNGFPVVPINVKGLGASDPVKPLSSCPGSGQAQIDCLAVNRRVVVELK